jgi:EthD domain
MLKEYLILSGRDQKSHAQCQDYVINVHAQAVLKHRAFQGVFRKYVMYPAVPRDTLSAGHHLYADRHETPMIVEHVCDDGALFRHALQDEDHRAAIKPDEEYIMHTFLSGPPIVVELEERVIFSGPVIGQFHIFDVLKRHADVSEEEFFSALDREAAYLAELTPFRNVVCKLIHNRVSKHEAVYAQSGGTGASTGRDFDAVVETVLGASSLEEIAGFYPAIRDRQSRFVDAAGSFSFIARRHVLIDQPASGRPNPRRSFGLGNQIN